MTKPNDYENHPLLQLRSGIENTNIAIYALSYGLNLQRFSRSVFTAQDELGVQIGFNGASSTLSSMVGNKACRDKAVSKAMLRINNVPTAPGLLMPKNGNKSAYRFAQEYGWPVVIKPVGGQGGKGVTANISTREQLNLAIKEADSSRGFLIEKHVPGEDFRFLVAGNRVLGVWRRDAANVVGDGENTISVLIDLKNKVRAQNPHLASRPIKKDQLVVNHLLKRGLKLDHVPHVGEKVYLRSAANLSSGGDNIEITDQTHQSLKDIAVKAKNVIPGIELVGVDLLLEDYRLPADIQKVNVCEINSLPGISAHDFPMYGPPRAAAKEYLEFIINKTGLKPSSYAESGVFDLSVYGSFIGHGFENEITEKASSIGLSVLSSTQTSKRLSVTVRGNSSSAAVLDALALFPRPESGRAEATRISRSALE